MQELNAWYNINNSSLEILLPSDSPGIISIYDVSGRLLFESNSLNESKVSIPLNFPEKNIYLIRFLSEEGSFTTKIAM
ncbi:MAG: T9SS type A sorting domain-containing protein [Bacteroidetes bacterium]|nr:T9SS type A sorting domain-containing protein [Bacteroidota bacterium]